MAQVKYSRIDSRKSALNYCSTVVIAVFVAVCLLGIWFLTSSSVGPVQNPELPSKEQSDFGLNKPVQFEDSQGELPDNSSSTSSFKEEDGEKKAEPDDDITASKPESGGKGNGNTEPSENRTDVDDVSNEGEGERDGSVAEREDDAGEQGEKSGVGERESSAVEKSENATRPEPELLPSVAQSELLNETTVAQNGSWATQAAESRTEKEGLEKKEEETASAHVWRLCNTTAGADYIPCLDNAEALKLLRSTKHYEHRERHCPESSPTCLVPLPEGYRRPIKWPESRDRIWYTNVPHTKLAEIKGHQNWVKVSGDYLTFPGGGTQFKHGALHYIEFIEQTSGAVAWGRRSRVLLDVGCGVASFGGYLFEKDVLSMSFAPKDEHEAQVQFALERGIPAISAVMGTNRLPFPSIVFDAVHCARCRVPWHIEGGKLLLELNRVLRPGGFFVWSATPVYQKHPEDVRIWKEMGELTKAMCWKLVAVEKDTVNGVGAAVYRKPTTNECYRSRAVAEPPLCAESDDPNAAWGVGLQRCMHEVPTDEAKRGSQWPFDWPGRLTATPYWLGGAKAGVYGRAAPEDFTADHQHWSRVVRNSYLRGMGIDWGNVRNVMDMRAVYGGFAASLKDLKVWVMNVVSVDSPDTLQIIYERGLFGIYHDWCESFSTYPRSYDLLHADHLFSKIKNKCGALGLMAEVDRILRPEGSIIVRDNVEMVGEVEAMARSMRWVVRLTYTKEKEALLCLQKTTWRPVEPVAESA